MIALERIHEGDPLPERVHRPTNASLFLFNAANWTAARIHYDHEYVTQAEGYPGIIINGPLQLDLISQVLTAWMDGQARLLRLKSNHRLAAYLGETLRAGGTVAKVDRAAREVTLDLYVKNERGEVITPGEAVVRFDAEG
jgi:hydroxyacyl-ACP dehydratase HTD2-like protein with hotdog domain